MTDYQALLDIKRATPDWENLKLLKFERNLYVEHPQVAQRSDEDVVAYRKARHIRVAGPAPKPVTTFAESQLPQYVLDVCTKEGFRAPTDVQAQVWPTLMRGHDAVVVAETGSGKTLSYLLPAVPHIMNQPLLENGEGPICLVVCPARELAHQIHCEAEKFLTPCRVKSCTLYGGVSRQDQAAVLARCPEVVIATPGRLLDQVDWKATNLFRVSYVVLDEADKLLSMGCENFINKIEALIRPDRQAVMLSATLPQELNPVITKYLRHPENRVTIRIGAGGAGELAACKGVTQEVKVLAEEEKLSTLATDLVALFKTATRAARSHIVRAAGGVTPRVGGGAPPPPPPPPPQLPAVVVFCATKAKVDEVYAALKATPGIPPVRAIHGGMDQEDRFASLESFKAMTARVLVSTNVTGRGIDIPTITHVYSLDFPGVIEDYVHRVGRTGRAGRKGHAMSYITHESYSLVPDLVAFLEESDQPVPEALRAMNPQALKRKGDPDAPDAGGPAAKRRCLTGLDYAASSYDASLSVVPQDAGVGVARRAGTAGQLRAPVAAGAVGKAAVTYYSTNPSTVLMLRNVVPPGGVDATLKEEMWEECERLSGPGEVLDVVVYEHKRWRVLSSKLPDEEVVRIFVKFRKAASAVEAYKVMHGRQFDGRTVVATFFDPKLFEEGSLSPADDEPKMSTTILIRNMAYPEELDHDFIPDIVSEMTAFGEVKNCEVHVVPEDDSRYSGLAREERVRVFVRFASTYGAMQALVNVDGRTYAGRELAAHLYDDIRADLEDYLPAPDAEPPLPIRCFISTEAPPLL